MDTLTKLEQSHELAPEVVENFNNLQNMEKFGSEEEKFNETVTQMQAVSQRITETADNLKKELESKITEEQMRGSVESAEKIFAAKAAEIAAGEQQKLQQQESFDNLSESSGNKMEAMMKSEKVHRH